MNDGHVIELLRAIGMMWPTVPVNQTEQAVKVRIWRHVLDDIEYNEALAVLVEHSRTGVLFPPAPGVIAERALTLRERAAGTYAPDPDQALAEVMAGIRRGGINLLDPKRQPRHQWSHPAVAAAVRAMGWRDMCLSDKPDVVRAQFLRIYGDATARHRERTRRTPAMRALIAAGAPRELTTTTGETNEHTHHPAEPDPDTERGADVVDIHPARRRRSS